MKKSLAQPVQYLKGIGPARARILAKNGIATIEDLFYYFPRRYEDRTRFLPIAKLKEGEAATVSATVLARGARGSFRRRRFSIVEIAVTDETGVLSCVWFNQGYLRDYFQPGQKLILYGKAERYGGRLQMSSPEFELQPEDDAGAQSLNAGRIVPVYPLPEGISQKVFRKIIKRIFEEYISSVEEFLPYDIRTRQKLLNLAKSLINIHFPESFELQKEAYRRLSFEEFFLFQLPLILRKLKRKETQGIAHRTKGVLVDNFLHSLTFSLTGAQKRAVEEIAADMASVQVMQRLLQGDVGSGKTVVATVACVMAIQGGYQAALMVPTEVLARQHYEKIVTQLACLKKGGKAITVGLLTGSAGKRGKEEILRKVKKGDFDLVIGTHALLDEKVEFKKLGLAVIDEQHKFGVGQRALLPQKGISPDILIMTATPIPRTLAITLYGDLDVSVINELPPGRPVITTIHYRSEEAARAYSLARRQLSAGKQVFVVYPVIEESYALDIAGAQKMYQSFKSGEFADYRVGLIHGRLPQKEQDEVMAAFKEGKIDVLVSTTVLEVGIDIPNATCMIIEYAERFGLSQLHQLRGRVGRGVSQSYCVLISFSQGGESLSRLEAMVAFSDGFRIAEEDLKIRGPGEFFGRRQHGLTELRIANPLTQMQLLKHAREEAISLIAKDPLLDERAHLQLKTKLLQRFPEYKEFSMAG
jgi:ATP-dependent DNA helicase RecG